MLELRVPKLIVRKVVVKEGSDETETMKVYSPDKSKKLTEIGMSFVPDLIPEVKPRKKVRSRRSSRASSVASLESLNHNKKRKKKSRLESSSSDDDTEERVSNQGDTQHSFLHFFYNILLIIFASSELEYIHGVIK